MNDLYKEHILDHFQNPRNRGVIERADIYYRDTNLLCGDEVAVYAKVINDSISQFSFVSRGCAISQAAASILSEHAISRPLKEIYKISSEDMISLLMIPISPARIKCAVLALKAFQAGIVLYGGKNVNAGNK